MAFEEYGLEIAATLGVATGIAAVLVHRIRMILLRISFYSFANSEVDSALISADRVLKNGATPAVVRKFLLVMLQTLASPEVGRDFTEWFSERNGSSKQKKPGKSNELSAAIDRLHVENPALGADVHRALMGIVMTLPIIYADRVDILGIVSEGATNPESVFDKAAKAVTKITSGRSDNQNGGPKLAGC